MMNDEWLMVKVLPRPKGTLPLPAGRPLRGGQKAVALALKLMTL